jgi:hypothetical protein
MPTAGKFCTLSSPSEHHPFYTIILELIQPLLFICSGWDLDQTVIRPIRQVVRRSSIRGLKDDYHHVDTDVVLIEGEVHREKAVSVAPHFRSHTFSHDGQY